MYPDEQRLYAIILPFGDDIVIKRFSRYSGLFTRFSKTLVSSAPVDMSKAKFYKTYYNIDDARIIDCFYKEFNELLECYKVMNIE